MAYATEVTISTGNKVSLNYQSQEVGVTLTYQLERTDENVLAVVQDKAREVAAAHRLAWEQVHRQRVGMQDPSDVPIAAADATAPEGLRSVAEPTETEEPADIDAPPEPAVPDAACAEHGMATDDVPATDGQIQAIRALLVQSGWSDEQERDYLRSEFRKEKLKHLSEPEAMQWLLHLQRSEREKAQERIQQRRQSVARCNGHL